MSRPQSANNNKVLLSAVGDLAIHGQYDEFIEKHSPHVFFEHVSGFFKNSDIVFGNLETVLSVSGTPKPDKPLCLRGNPLFLEGLKYAGFNVLSLGNNHSFDFGVEGYLDMKEALESSGIHVVGGGRDINDSRRPLIIEKKAIKILFLAYSDKKTGGFNEACDGTPGVAPLNIEIIKEDIKKHRDSVNCIIVSLHWGEEFNHYPSPQQVVDARAMIDSGADLILGHHSHVLQGIEEYKSGVIAYNLGSMMMSGPSGTYEYVLQENNRESVILNCEISEKGISGISFMPVWLNDKLYPVICKDSREKKILETVEDLSKAVMKEDYPEFWRDMTIRNRIKNPVREWFAKGNYLKRVKNIRPGDIKRPINLVVSYLRILLDNR
jgi:poly-gamma-glutamate synthesis protein (capsule biosynthesis protein)